jgi:hypothetical protein
VLGTCAASDRRVARPSQYGPPTTTRFCWAGRAASSRRERFAEPARPFVAGTWASWPPRTRSSARMQFWPTGGAVTSSHSTAHRWGCVSGQQAGTSPRSSRNERSLAKASSPSWRVDPTSSSTPSETSRGAGPWCRPCSTCTTSSRYISRRAIECSVPRWITQPSRRRPATEPSTSTSRTKDRCTDNEPRRVELQLRTALQHEWADHVEEIGRRLGVALKNGEGPAAVVASFRELGELYAAAEVQGSTPALAAEIERHRSTIEALTRELEANRWPT